MTQMNTGLGMMQEENGYRGPSRTAVSATVAPAPLLEDRSLEATMPTRRDIDMLTDRLAPGTRVYLSALPRLTFAEQAKTATALSRAGLDPVPHLPARRFPDAAELRTCVRRLRNDAGVDKVLVIAGDIANPLGAYKSSLDVIRDDGFLAAGFSEVGISGYPDGHPLIDSTTLDAHQEDKIRVLVMAGIGVEIATQFSFDAAKIATWHDRLRQRGIVCPVRIGLAGPANAATLLKLALRCGVSLPSRATNTAAQLLRGRGIDEIYAALSAGSLGQNPPHKTSLHVYSFGGIRRTLDWLDNAD